MTAAVQIETGIFDGGPQLKLERHLHLTRAGETRFVRRALIVVVIGWAPLVVLTSVQSVALHAQGLGAFLYDVAVHTRSLIAAPLLILAEAVCGPRLSAIGQHFLDAGLVRDADKTRFAAFVTSTRTLLDSTLAEILVVGLAYALVLALIGWVAPENYPGWHRTSNATDGRLSVAGWWHVLVSLPLLLVLLLSWIWRLVLWTRFLLLTSRLDLQLVPAHPDRAAGLMFVGYSLRAFSIVAFAIGTIVAGTVANSILRAGTSPFDFKYVIAGVAAAAMVLFGGPLLTLAGTLLREWRRGVFEYGALADRFGKQFERKWFDLSKRVDETALDVQDFSAASDLYQIVGNVHAMRWLPVDLNSVLLLALAVLLPIVPTFLLAVPLDQLLSGLANLLL